MKCAKCERTIENEKMVYCIDCFGIENIKLHDIFKRKVLKFRGRKCSICKRKQCKDVKLTLHHVDENIEDRYDTSNVQVVCRECHNKIHRSEKELGNQ